VHQIVIQRDRCWSNGLNGRRSFPAFASWADRSVSANDPFAVWAFGDIVLTPHLCGEIVNGKTCTKQKHQLADQAQRNKQSDAKHQQDGNCNLGDVQKRK